MPSIRIYDYIVFINSVRIPDRYITNVSIRNVPVNELSTCIITFSGEKGQFIYQSYLQPEPTETLKQIALKKGHTLHYKHPIFMDNDVVVVLIRLQDQWKWGFFGYIDTVTYEENLINEVATITISAESSLRSFRYNHFSFNSLLVPEELKTGHIEKFYTNVQGIYQSIPLSNLTLEEQIEELFFGTTSTKVSGQEGFGEGSFEPPLNTIRIESRTELSKVNKELEERVNISESDINAVIRQIETAKFGHDERNFFPKRKVYFVHAGGRHWLDLTRTIGLSYPQMQNLVLENKLDILTKIISNWLYVAYTLGNGDVVIEPLMFGELEGLVTVTSNDLIRYSSGISGQAMKTVAFTPPSIFPVLMTGSPQVGGTMQNVFPHVPAVVDKKLLALYGMRVVQYSTFLEKLKHDIASKMNKLLLLKSWASAKTARITSLPIKEINHINRSILVEQFETILLLSSYTLTIDANKSGIVDYGGSYAAFKTVEGDYSFGRPLDSKEYTVLDFLFDINEAIKKGKIEELRKKIIDEYEKERKQKEEEEQKKQQQIDELRSEIIKEYEEKQILEEFSRETAKIKSEIPGILDSSVEDYIRNYILQDKK